MTVITNVPGACEVKVGTGSSNALESLGWTVDGVEIREKEYVLEVKSDRYGGQAGPPIDVQLMGLGAEISLELSEFDPVVFKKLQSRLPTNATISATPGVTPTPGCLTFQDGGLFRLLLFGAKDAEEIAANGSIDLDLLLTPLNYPFCRIVDAISFNLGARSSKASVKIEAYQGLVSSTITLWNRVTA